MVLCQDCVDFNRIYCTRCGLDAVALAYVTAPSGTVLMNEALCALHESTPRDSSSTLTPVTPTTFIR